MFIVRVYDWHTDQMLGNWVVGDYDGERIVGPFASAEAASLWVEGQVRNDNEDIDYEICPLLAP